MKEKELTPNLFVKGLVAKLARGGENYINFNNSETRKGFLRILNSLEKNLESVDGTLHSQLIYTINELSPSRSTGALDYFKFHFRALQRSYTRESPLKPGEFLISVSPEFAGSFLNTMDPAHKTIIETAFRAYNSSK